MNKMFLMLPKVQISSFKMKKETLRSDDI